MSDESVAALLRSDEPLVVIEAAAGAGKTYQGAAYARDLAVTLGSGRLLILTHTHAACTVFAERTAGAGRSVEIKTIDALIAQIATAYHAVLDLPADVSAWAWQDEGKGFGIMASKVASFLGNRPMVARALACRYPFIVCDEHQDSSPDQHAVVMALHRSGAMLRVFGDPLQSIYDTKSAKAARANRERWETLKSEAAWDRLDHPHRWEDGDRELGHWLRKARENLENGNPIDLTSNVPRSVQIIRADNTAQTHGLYMLSQEDRRQIDQNVQSQSQLMILTAQTDLARGLRSFWNRSIPIWEGHTRNALADFVSALDERAGNAEAIAAALAAFVSTTAKGFSESSHGRRLIQEVRNGCAKSTTGKPANIQLIAKCVLEFPDHRGASAAIRLIGELINQRAAGFDAVYIDYRTEFNEAKQLDRYPSAQGAFAEISRKRAYVRPSPPSKTISSIHKAKGLECDHSMLIPCDDQNFRDTPYKRCMLYVALTRAKHSLRLVVPRTNPSPLIRLS